MLSTIALKAIRLFPGVMKYLTMSTIKALGGYQAVRDEYWAIVYDAVEEFLLNAADVSITGFKNRMYNAMNSAFQTGAELGYEDGGGAVPLDSETQSWLDGEILMEKENINNLFAGLRENWQSKDAIREAFARADGYTAKLDSVFGQAKMNGAGNPSLTWHLGETEEHCSTCSELDGTKHKAQWYIEKNYIPRKPGADMECGGWNCDCRLVDKDGSEYMV